MHDAIFLRKITNKWVCIRPLSIDDGSDVIRSCFENTSYFIFDRTTWAAVAGNARVANIESPATTRPERSAPWRPWWHWITGINSGSTDWQCKSLESPGSLVHVRYNFSPKSCGHVSRVAFVAYLEWVTASDSPFAQNMPARSLVVVQKSASSHWAQVKC